MGLDRYLNVIPWNPAHNKLEVDNLNGPYQQLKPMDRQNMRTILGVLKHYRISYNLAFSAASGRGNDTISFIVDSSAKTDSVIRSIPGVTNRVMSRERQYFPQMLTIYNKASISLQLLDRIFSLSIILQDSISRIGLTLQVRLKTRLRPMIL